MEMMSESDARMVYVTFKNKEPNHLESEKRKKMTNKFSYDFIVYLAINGIPISEMDSIFENCLNINNWKKGMHLEKSIQQRTLKNFHKRCSICGCEDNLTIHHIKAKSDYPELKYRIGNMMLVCKDCHKRMHMIEAERTLHVIGDKNGIE